MFETEADAEIDALLRTALADRPEPRCATDLAARVLRAAGTRRAPSVWPVVVAAVAMAAVILVGMLRVAAIESSLASASGTATDVASTTGDAVTLLPVGGIGLVIALFWLTAGRALERSDRGLLAAG